MLLTRLKKSLPEQHTQHAGLNQTEFLGIYLDESRQLHLYFGECECLLAALANGFTAYYRPSANKPVNQLSDIFTSRRRLIEACPTFQTAPSHILRQSYTASSSTQG
jgi:hypothetical protein